MFQGCFDDCSSYFQSVYKTEALLAGTVVDKALYSP